MDTSALLLVIKDWQRRVTISQEGHDGRARSLDKYHYALGLPTAIFAAITSATVFLNLEKEVSLQSKVIVGCISLAAAILAAVQTFYSHAKRSETHRLISVQLGAVRREIDILIALPPKDEAVFEQKVRELNAAITKISQDAPVIDLKPPPAPPSSGPFGGGPPGGTNPPGNPMHSPGGGGMLLSVPE